MYMRAFSKACLLFLVTAFVTFSCNVAETTAPSTDLSTVTLVSAFVSETPAPTLVPEQNNLIFIEFFAGT